MPLRVTLLSAFEEACESAMVGLQFLLQSGDVSGCEVQSGFPPTRREWRYRNMSDQFPASVVFSGIGRKLYPLQGKVTL